MPSDYLAAEKIQKGYYDLTPNGDGTTLRLYSDDETDFWDRVLADRHREVAGWTEAFWRRTFPEAFPVTRYDIPRLEKETVRERASVLRLLDSLGIEHIVRGDNALFRCPWHDDHKPSASFSIRKKVWCCFPCVAGGDLFSFVQRLQGIGFSQAVAEVDRCG